MPLWLTTVIHHLMALACAWQPIGSSGLRSWRAEMKQGIVVLLPGRIHTLVKKEKPDGKETSKQKC